MSVTSRKELGREPAVLETTWSEANPDGSVNVTLPAPVRRPTAANSREVFAGAADRLTVTGLDVEVAVPAATIAIEELVPATWSTETVAFRKVDVVLTVTVPVSLDAPNWASKMEVR